MWVVLAVFGSYPLGNCPSHPVPTWHFWNDHVPCLQDGICVSSLERTNGNPNRRFQWTLLVLQKLGVSHLQLTTAYCRISFHMFVACICLCITFCFSCLNQKWSYAEVIPSDTSDWKKCSFYNQLIWANICTYIYSISYRLLSHRGFIYLNWCRISEASTATTQVWSF